MRKENKRKYLTIDIQYQDKQELRNILQRIGSLAALGMDSYKEKGDGSAFEFELSYIFDESSPMREEIINGERCLVFQSKLNNQNDE